MYIYIYRNQGCEALARWEMHNICMYIYVYNDTSYMYICISVYIYICIGIFIYWYLYILVFEFVYSYYIYMFIFVYASIYIYMCGLLYFSAKLCVKLGVELFFLLYVFFPGQDAVES